MSDYLLRHEGFPGTWDIAYMTGPDSSTIQPLPGLPVGDGYYTAGTADFDGDGDPDILLRNQLGQWFMYIIENGAVINSATLPIFPIPGEGIMLKGDFDADGKRDFIVRQPNTGAVTVYYMDGVNIKRTQAITGMPGFAFREDTSGDYDGDGMPEFLFRKAAGLLALEWWIYDIDFITGIATGTPLPALDQVAGMDWVGQTSKDYDNDGDEEPLMRSLLNPYGWQLVQLDGPSGGLPFTVGSADSLPFNALGYLEVANGVTVLGMDMNNNGYKEIVLRNEGLNLYHFYEMDGPIVINEGPVSLPPFPAARRSQVK
jgi:hypothetical protein